MSNVLPDYLSSIALWSLLLALFILTSMACGQAPAPDRPATAQLPKIDWADGWDPAVGLWVREGAGTTPAVAKAARVHPAPDAATRLFIAAEMGQLDHVNDLAILTALRKLQVTEPGTRQGCLRWYWEEPAPYDTNATFFAAMSLIALRKCHYAQLDAPAQRVLDVILGDMHVWFAHNVEEDFSYYPNKYLGDLVCAWLLAEMHAPQDAHIHLRDKLLAAADYWQQHGWGWGEHLSDIYAGICLDLLSMLLVLSEQLPDQVRQRYQQLFTELLRLEDVFAGGPRVPAIRSYNFLVAPSPPVPYRDRIQPLAAELTLARLKHKPPLNQLFARRGWHTLAPPRAERGRDITVPCFGGAVATARLEDDARLGSLSHFPLMPSAEHAASGLSWQSFPVSFWQAVGDWGYLQWEVREDGKRRCHPGEGKDAQKDTALTLAISPPLVGRTYALQRGGNLIVLRIMPMIPAAWEQCADRFRLVNGHAELTACAPVGTWSQLLLQYPEREVSLHCIPLSSRAVPALSKGTDGATDWGISLAEGNLHRYRLVATLWAVSLDGKIHEAPTITREVVRAIPRDRDEYIWRVEWKWPNTTWRLRIDPLDSQPLRDLAIPMAR
jgi:hypothetical protein